MCWFILNSHVNKSARERVSRLLVLEFGHNYNSCNTMKRWCRIAACVRFCVSPIWFYYFSHGSEWKVGKKYNCTTYPHIYPILMGIFSVAILWFEYVFHVSVCVYLFLLFLMESFSIVCFFRCFFSYDAHIAHNLFPTFVRVIAYAEKQNLAKNIAYNVQDSRFYCYGYCILPHIYTWYVCVVVVVLVVACVCEHSRVYLSV